MKIEGDQFLSKNMLSHGATLSRHKDMSWKKNLRSEVTSSNCVIHTSIGIFLTLQYYKFITQK